MNISDSALVCNVRDTLKKDVRTADQTIDVLTSEGVVLLFGTADTEEHAKVATQIVRGLVGVREVLDRMNRRHEVTEKAA